MDEKKLPLAEKKKNKPDRIRRGENLDLSQIFEKVPLILMTIILILMIILNSARRAEIKEALNYGFDYGYDSAVRDYTGYIAKVQLDVAQLKKFSSRIKFSQAVKEIYSIEVLEQWEVKQIDKIDMEDGGG